MAKTQKEETRPCARGVGRQGTALDQLELTCLPPEFHFYPDRIAPAMEDAAGPVEASLQPVRFVFEGVEPAIYRAR
jgi:hypothetical protein